MTILAHYLGVNIGLNSSVQDDGKYIPNDFTNFLEGWLKVIDPERKCKKKSSLLISHSKIHAAIKWLCKDGVLTSKGPFGRPFR